MQGSLLGCDYYIKIDPESMYRSPRISIENWAYIMVESRLDKAKEKNQENYDSYSSSKSLVVDHFTIEENRTAFIYYEGRDGEGQRKGGLRNHYNGHSITISGSEIPWDFTDELLALEKCMMVATDEFIIRNEAKENNLPKLTFVIDGRPLKNLYVHSDQGSFYTDEFGTITIRESASWIDINFAYISNKHVFSFVSPDGEDLALNMRLDDGVITSLKFDVGTKRIDLDIVDKEMRNFNIEDYVDQIGFYLYNYMYFQDAALFYEELGVEFETPVKIQIQRNYERKGSYLDNLIILDVDHVDVKNPFNPYTQYHEFSHFVMDMLYGSVFDEIIKEKNHGGYANPSTADSWSEGFAAFMAVQIANDNAHYWATSPSEANEAVYPYAGSLETNYLPWGAQGLNEEFAIASLLWDLVDDDHYIVYERESLGLDLAFLMYFRAADANKDKIISRDEYILHHLQQSGNSIEYSEFDWLGMIDYGEQLFGKYDLTTDMTIFDKYSGDDSFVEGDELLALADIMKYEYKEDIVIRWIELYDSDNDSKISKLEAKKLLGGYEVINHISQGEEILYLEDIEKLVEDPVIQKAYWEFDKTEYIYEELFDKLTKNMDHSDDEDLNMNFDVLWKIMINNHKDFTSFIDELSESKDESYKMKLAYTLIDHGLYIDANKGNGIYDSGIEAFVDVNDDGVRQDSESFIDYPLVWSFSDNASLDGVGNYQRSARHSSPILPGQSISGAKQVAYFIWDGPILKNYFLIETGGYIPVPPGSVIYAGNNKEVTYFTETTFTENYENIVDQGYIAKLKSSKSSFLVWLIIILLLIISVVVVRGIKKNYPKKFSEYLSFSKKFISSNKEKLITATHIIKKHSKHISIKVHKRAKKGATAAKQFYNTEGKKALNDFHKGSNKVLKEACVKSKTLAKIITTESKLIYKNVKDKLRKKIKLL